MNCLNKMNIVVWEWINEDLMNINKCEWITHIEWILLSNNVLVQANFILNEFNELRQVNEYFTNIMYYKLIVNILLN